MIKKILKYSVLLFVFVITETSCTKDVDFNQINDLILTPVFESSLIYIDEPASRFLVQGNEVTYVQDAANIDFFQEDYVVEHLIKADFFFETTNSINRGFQVQVDMYDDFNQLLHSFSFFSDPSPDNSEVVNEHLEVFEGSTLNALKNTSKFVFTLTLQTGEPINENTPGRIILRSKGTFYLSIEK